MARIPDEIQALVLTFADPLTALRAIAAGVWCPKHQQREIWMAADLDILAKAECYEGIVYQVDLMGCFGVSAAIAAAVNNKKAALANRLMTKFRPTGFTVSQLINDACVDSNLWAVQYYHERTGMIGGLVQAAVANCVELVDYLCGKGAPGWGHAFQAAVRLGKCEAATALFKHSPLEPQVPFEFACTSGPLEVVMALHGCGGVATSKALVQACRRTNPSIAAFLVECGAETTEEAVVTAVRTGQVLLLRKLTGFETAGLNEAIRIKALNVVRYYVLRGVQHTVPLDYVESLCNDTISFGAAVYHMISQ